MNYDLIEFEGEGYLFLSGFEKIKEKMATIDQFDVLNNQDAQSILDTL